MTDNNQLSEALLEGWLRMSKAIWNERLVSAMTYNESMVCNLLNKQRKKSEIRLTPTDLCDSLKIRKSQMNVILNKLEKEAIIIRERSRQDKRNVYVYLTEKGIQIYETAHEEILQIPKELIRRLGEEKAREFSDMMMEVSDCFEKMMVK